VRYGQRYSNQTSCPLEQHTCPCTIIRHHSVASTSKAQRTHLLYITSRHTSARTLIICLAHSTSSVLCAVARLRDGHPKNCGSSVSTSKGPSRLWPPPSLLPNGYSMLFPQMINWPRREAISYRS